MQINQLKPEIVFYYFSEISKIPRGSGNMEAIARYCVDFAKRRNLRSYRDTYGNVMIFKDGTLGYEQSEPVILQGHLDMVCEKLPKCTKDMDKEGLDLVTDGNWLRAEGTTLGADDGIAIAYILAVLASDDISHPPIEALLTADEEIGLLGAKALDTRYLKGRRLINIDSEQEGVLTTGCAGAVRAKCEIPITQIEADNERQQAKKISIGGLTGGHSGLDINKRRKNAVRVLAELLYELNKQIGISIADINAGGKLNVIPVTSEAVICFPVELCAGIEAVIDAFRLELKKDCANTESGAFVSCSDVSVPKLTANQASSSKIIFALMNIFNGIYLMSDENTDLVQMSSNLGNVYIDGNNLEIGIMIRSNTEWGKRPVIRRAESMMEYIGGKIHLQADYPSWEYVRHSPLREVMMEEYRAMYGGLPKIHTVHIGLECGVLSEKLPEADMISFGPDIEKVHTPDEKISIPSVMRCWTYLLRILKVLK